MEILSLRPLLLKEMKLKKRNTDGVVLHKPYPNPG